MVEGAKEVQPLNTITYRPGGIGVVAHRNVACSIAIIQAQAIAEGHETPRLGVRLDMYASRSIGYTRKRNRIAGDRIAQGKSSPGCIGRRTPELGVARPILRQQIALIRICSEIPLGSKDRISISIGRKQGHIRAPIVEIPACLKREAEFIGLDVRLRAITCAHGQAFKIILQHRVDNASHCV